MIKKLLLLSCTSVIFFTPYQAGAMHFDNKNINELNNIIQRNVEQMTNKRSGWVYILFEDFKKQEKVKENFDNHISALQALKNKIADTETDLFDKFLRFNEHLFYTVKEIRQSYLPKDAIDPETEQGANFYRFYATQVKSSEIKKLLDLLEKEYTLLSSSVIKTKNLFPKDNAKFFLNSCDVTLEKGFYSNYFGLFKDYEKLLKVTAQKGDSNAQNSTFQTGVKGDDNSLTQQWPEILREFEPRVMKDNKELLPQFKKIKEAAIALVYYINNKGKSGYNTVEKHNALLDLLPDLKKMQKTAFEKKFFLSKKKAIGKEMDKLLAKVINDIESNG